jgi:hypothetical protein
MDPSNRNMAVLTLNESELQKPAIDVVFDLIGIDDPAVLVDQGLLPANQVDDLKALQQMIFECDAQGMFIREGVNFKANGFDLDPDSPIISAFLPAEKDGHKYFRCELIVGSASAPVKPTLAASQSQPQTAVSVQVPLPIRTGTGSAQSPMQSKEAQQNFAPPAGDKRMLPPDVQASNEQAVLKFQQAVQQSAEDSMREFAKVMFLHQIACGYQIDVTKEIPELMDLIALCEKEQLIEIDVQKASYKLSASGCRLHDTFMGEAQELIKRYDIFGDVDIDSSGTARFDTGLGKDMRVPIFELEGVNPFRARFLIGLCDGEWDKMEDWWEKVLNADWYQGIFEIIEVAPSVEDIGRPRLNSILEQGKAVLRQDASLR